MSNARNLSQGDTRFVNTSGDTMTGDLGVSNGGVHVTSPSGIEGLIVDTDQSNSAVSGRIVLKNNTSASSVYYSDSLGWTFHTGTVLGSTSGTQRMYLTPQGYLRTPYQPAFRAGRSSSISGIQTVTFDVVHHNTGNHYSTSNGRFTAPVAGVYYFAWQGISGSSSTTNEQNVTIAVNGGGIHDSRFRGYTESGGHVITVVYLSVNDYVTVVISNPSTSLYPSAFHNQFMGYLIG